MKIEHYQKLKAGILNTSFESNYKAVSNVLNSFSYLGNTASIVFAFSFLYTILNNVYTQNFFAKNIIIGIVTVIVLIGFESIKRLIFKQCTLNVLKKSNKFEQVFTGILSLLIIVSSSFLSISGAKEVADKSKNITKNLSIETKNITDSLNRLYDLKEAKLETIKSQYFNFIVNGTKKVSLRTQYNELIKSTDTQIKELNQERKNDIKDAVTGINAHSNNLIKDSNTNVFCFLLISGFIELIILVGVWFKSYYEYQSFIEFDAKVNSCNKLKRFMTYYELIHLLYNHGKHTVGHKLSTNHKFNSLIKINDLNVTPKALNDFYVLLTHLNIIVKETASKRLINKDYVTALNEFKAYYNFK